MARDAEFSSCEAGNRNFAFARTIIPAREATENVYLRINRVVLRPDKLISGSLIGRDTSPSSSAVGGAVSFSLSSSSPYSPLAIRQSLLSSSIVKMMSDPSEEKSSTRVRMHLGEFPLQTSPEVYVTELLAGRSSVSVVSPCRHVVVCSHSFEIAFHAQSCHTFETDPVQKVTMPNLR